MAAHMISTPSATVSERGGVRVCSVNRMSEKMGTAYVRLPRVKTHHRGNQMSRLAVLMGIKCLLQSWDFVCAQEVAKKYATIHLSP